ncbi:MAG TPA: RsmE family RNA methyltransferase [Candidatus Nitrosotalea sp.]|nr:RsmE family RNA methyltransferase [Candidatus Nitrosotalea sp.]
MTRSDPARRFFVEGTRAVGDLVEIDASDAHKIARVLRLHSGDHIEIVDSSATAFDAELELAPRAVRARLVEALAANSSASGLALDVAQAIPKAARMEFVIEKGTELGASGFLPFYSERSVRREVGAEKLARWRRLARTASAQCGRREVPEVREPVEFDALLAALDRYDAVLFAWELASGEPLRERLRTALPGTGRALIVIGPEGGFTHSEAEKAVRHGATLISLGPRILRTDTAAMALLAVIGALAS